MQKINKKLLQHLAPIDDAKSCELYTRELKNGIDDKDVKNIALAGAYGSGKSSIIKTFENKYSHKNRDKDNLKILNISLAEFEDSKINKTSIDVERSILQKIFYSVKDEDIPYSRFKRIKDLSKEEIATYSLYGFIWTICTFIAYKNSNLPDFLEPIKFNAIYYIALLISFIGIFFILPKLIQIGSRFDFLKINIKDGKLDLAEKKDSSILNKNIDEILYFFKATKYKVIFFEDLDRVEKTDDKSNIDIFMKLREINLILNNSDEIEHNITFVYAIKDDNFQGENRTKFFDLIIPVIPFVDYSNSSDQLRTMIDSYKDNMQYKEDSIILKDSFINKISLYIDNMRLLINIFNEFVVYKEKLANDQLKNYKLFSMIVYKNLLPDDFSKLCLNDGIVYKILEKKQSLINNKLTDIEQSIEKINNDIQDIKNESVESIEELRSIFIYHILKYTSVHNNRLIISGKVYLIKDLHLDKNFEDLYNATEIWSDLNNTKYAFKSIEKNIAGKSYKERLDLINDKQDNKIEELKKQLLQKTNEKDLIKGMLFKELVDVDTNLFADIDVEKFNMEKSSGLIIFLISNGYIDESYKHYISIFYEKSITKEDRDYILSVIEKRDNLGYDFKLTNIEQIIEQLEDVDFAQNSALNYQIYQYFIKHNSDNNHNYKRKYDLFTKQLQNTQNLEFIDGYLEYSNDINSDEVNNDIFNRFLWIWKQTENSNFLVGKKELYLHYILKYTNIEYLLRINKDNRLSTSIANKENFLQLTQDINIKKIKDVISKLKIKFVYLDIKDDNKELFDFIYKNNHYVITFDFIEKILKYFNTNNIDTTLLEIENYTTIRKSSCEPLQEYIEDNINEYVKTVLIECESNTNESENSIISLINNEDLENVLKSEILTKSSNKIINIEDIHKEYWSLLLETNALKSSWENVSKFYNEKDKQLNDVLINYLNIEENSSPLLTVRIGKQYVDNNPDFDTNLLRKIIENNSFNLESYSNLVRDNWYIFNNLNISELDEEKISVLVKDKSILRFRADNYNLLKKNSNKQHTAFLIKHINDFIRELKDEIIGVPEFPFNIDTQDVIDLLSSQTISIQNKRKIVETIDFDLITNNEIADLIYSFRDKTIIRAADYTRIMVHYLSTLEKKITLIVEQIEEFNDKEFFEILGLLPSEYRKIEKLNGKQPVLAKTDYNKRFIEILQNKGFITSSKEIPNNKIRIYLKSINK